MTESSDKRLLEKTHQEHIVNFLLKLRDEYEDEIPEQVLHSYDQVAVKARRTWMAGVTIAVSDARDHGYIKDPILLEDAENFLKWTTKGEFSQRGGKSLTTKEDIERGNKIIDKVLESLAKH